MHKLGTIFGVNIFVETTDEEHIRVIEKYFKEKFATIKQEKKENE